MTQFLWDASAWDWARGPMDLNAAKADGLVGFSHRATIGTTYKDPNLANGLNRARLAGIEILGAYMVVRTPGNAGAKPLVEQVDFYLRYLDEVVPWWRSWPAWFIQVDTEKWYDSNGVLIDAVNIALGKEACFWLKRIVRNKRIIHYAPRWSYQDTVPLDEPLWASHYVSTTGNFKATYPGDTHAGWATYSGRVPTLLQYSDNSIIGSQPRCDANAYRGTLTDLKKFVGGEGPTVTYAPGDLLAVRTYVQQKTGLPVESLGIVGDTSHNSSGGYHVGHDVLHLLGVAPEDPGGDYSYTESQRDRNGLTNAASAFDLGGNFSRFREITLGIVNACKNNDPRAREIREVIYTDNGTTVKRWDRLGIRNTGDSSHLNHTHISFFRDSDGFRDDNDNFLGLLKELFDGKPTPPPIPQEDNMPFAYPVQLPANVGDYVEVTIPPVNTGGFGWGKAWMKIASDSAANGAVSFRIALGNGAGQFTPANNDRSQWGYVDLTPTTTKWETGVIPDGTCVLAVTRVSSGDATADAKVRRMVLCVEYGPRA